MAGPHTNRHDDEDDLTPDIDDVGNDVPVSAASAWQHAAGGIAAARPVGTGGDGVDASGEGATLDGVDGVDGGSGAAGCALGDGDDAIVGGSAGGWGGAASVDDAAAALRYMMVWLGLVGPVVGLRLQLPADAAGCPT